VALFLCQRRYVGRALGHIGYQGLTHHDWEEIEPNLVDGQPRE
jgi:hypothetical protein